MKRKKERKICHFHDSTSPPNLGSSMCLCDHVSLYQLTDPYLCDEKIKHTQIWKKHRDTLNLLSITKVKLWNL